MAGRARLGRRARGARARGAGARWPRPRGSCPRWRRARAAALARRSRRPPPRVRPPRRPRDPAPARPRARPHPPGDHGHRQRDARLVLRPPGPEGAWTSWSSAARAAGRGRARRSSTWAASRAHRHRAVPVEEEIERVRAAGRAAGGGRACWSRWTPGAAPVARAALDAGAAMINDVSGLSDPSVADACAETGAALVITHTRAPPKTKAYPRLRRRRGDVRELLRERMAAARVGAASTSEQIVLDPGPDLAKSPAETVELLRRLPELAELGRPLLLAVSRKDFVGALTERPPAARDRRHARRGGRGRRRGRDDPARARRGRRARLPARARRARASGADDEPRARRRSSAGRRCERGPDHRPALRPPLRLAALRARACSTARSWRSTSSQPDVVVVSGDLTGDGFRGEYELAREYLDQIDCERMIVIPGNHDSRNVGYVHFEELFGERRSELHTERRLDRRGRLHRARPRPRR